MVETKRKTRGMEFLRELEEFVREREFPRRVIDSVVELREKLGIEENSAGVEEALLQIPALMNHIGRKYRTELTQETELLEDKIRLEDVQERVEEILTLFQDSNGPLTEQYRNGQSLAKTELENGIREILHTDAHYDCIRNGSSFCNYMTGVEQAYRTRTGQLLQSCTEDLFQNCDQMAARIKSLFTHLKDEKLQVVQRRMYQMYDSKYDLLKQKISAKAAQLSGEQNIVGQWAAGCVKPMEKIKKRIDCRKYVMILVPLVFALIAIPAFRFVMNVNVGQTRENAAIETMGETEVSDHDAMDQAGEQVSGKVVEQVAEKVGEQVAEKMGEKVGEQMEDKLPGFLDKLLDKVAIYIIGIAYVLYAVVIVKKSRQWYSEAVGGYLAPEVERFLETDGVQQDTQQKFEAIRTEMELDWRNLILELLNGGNYQEQMQVNSEAQQFQALVKEWETIRRLA